MVFRELKNPAAFTLVELIIYVGIVVVVLVSMTQFLWNVAGASLRVDVWSELNYNARLALERIAQAMRPASDILVIDKGYEGDSLKTDFDSGNYDKTQWDSANSWLELTSEGQTQGSGSFISRVFDAGPPISWDSISWLPQAPYAKELPGGASIETEYPKNNADMSGNVLLMHMNEKNGIIYDSSGRGNNGVNNGAFYNQPGRYKSSLKFQSASEQAMTLSSSADSWIYQGFSYLNGGNSTQLEIRPWNAGYNRRSLVRFDLAGIPAGAKINSAKLRLKEAATFGISRTIAAHRLTHSWIEGTGGNYSGVTWTTYDGAHSWMKPGGDYISPASAQTLVSYNPWVFPKIDEWDVVSDVQAFVNGSHQNYGWLLKDANEDYSQNFWHFSSKEGTQAPQLAVRYNASGSHVEIPHSNSLMPLKLTAEAWIKLDALPGTADVYGIISKGDKLSSDGYELFVASSFDPQSNRIGFAVGNAAVYSLNKPSLNKWIHIAGVYDGAQAKLYVNGVLQSSAGAVLTPNTRPFYIGRRYTNPAHFMSGYIDEVAVYERALNAVEIAAHYERGAANLYFQLRSGNSIPLTSQFSGPDGTSATSYSEQNNPSVSLPYFKISSLPAGRYVQYKAFLAVENLNLNTEVKGITIWTGGSVFGFNPARMVFDYPDKDVVIDTYMKNVIAAGKTASVRKLRMQIGFDPPFDITSDKVSVSNFVIEHRTRGSEAKNIKIGITLNYVNPAQEFVRDKSVSLETSVSIRKQ